MFEMRDMREPPIIDMRDRVGTDMRERPFTAMPGSTAEYSHAIPGMDWQNPAYIAMQTALSAAEIGYVDPNAGLLEAKVAAANKKREGDTNLKDIHLASDYQPAMPKVVSGKKRMK